jgi:hypothetical protein
MSTPSITGTYAKIGTMTKPQTEATSVATTSFADVLFKEPVKHALEASRTAEAVSLQAMTGTVDEQTLAESVSEADTAFQELKAIWSETLRTLKELPQIGM